MKTPLTTFLVVDTHRLYGTVVDMEHHLVRKDGTAFDFTDYATNPQDYESTFAEKVLSITHVTLVGNKILLA